MGIKKCKNCGMDLNYKSMLKGMFTNQFLCSNCGTVYKLTLGSRMTTILLLLLPSFILTWSTDASDFIRKTFPNLRSLILATLVYCFVIIVMSVVLSRFERKK